MTSLLDGSPVLLVFTTDERADILSADAALTMVGYRPISHFRMEFS